VQVRADHDPQARARVDVDVRVDAALADQAQLRQPLEQLRADLGALADQDERVEAGEPLGEGINVLDVVGEDRDLVAGKLLEALQRAERVEPIVEDRDLHRMWDGVEYAIRGLSPGEGRGGSIRPSLT
jgi:hypothetical protein